MTYKNVNVTRSEFVCSCLIFVFLVCVCLHTLYIYYITIIYTCMSWGQNLSAHDDFMIANHAWTLCLFTHIYRPWGQICLLMFIFVLLIWLCLFTYMYIYWSCSWGSMMNLWLPILLELGCLFTGVHLLGHEVRICLLMFML